MQEALSPVQKQTPDKTASNRQAEFSRNSPADKNLTSMNTITDQDSHEKFINSVAQKADRQAAVVKFSP